MSKTCTKKPYDTKHEGRVLSKEEVMEGRSSAYEFINFDRQETLEEVTKKVFPHHKGRTVTASNKTMLRRHAFIKGAKWQQEQILDFLHSEITERRDYSASKMCEKIIEFINKFKS